MQEPALQVRTDKVVNNPLLWWRDNALKFPTLAKLARMYLAIPATSAPSERIFSVASRVISKFRGGLDPQMAGMLLYVAENYKWYESMRETHELVPLPV